MQYNKRPLVFKNDHIATAFKLISSLHVSEEAVDVIWAAKQQLLMADKEFVKPEKDEVKKDG